MKLLHLLQWKSSLRTIYNRIEIHCDMNFYYKIFKQHRRVFL